jgi:hypothetical protein
MLKGFVGRMLDFIRLSPKRPPPSRRFLSQNEQVLGLVDLELDERTIAASWKGMIMLTPPTSSRMCASSCQWCRFTSCTRPKVESA